MKNLKHVEILFLFLLLTVNSSSVFAQELTNSSEELKRNNLSLDKCDIERISLFLKFLASKEPKERLLAIKVLESFAIQKKFPIEFILVLVQIYDKDGNADVIQASAGVLKLVAETDTTFFKMIIPRVSIIIQSEIQQSVATQLKNTIELMGIMTEIERRKPESRDLKKSAFISFNDEFVEADEIYDSLKGKMELDYLGSGLFKYYQIKKRPRHYELWLAPNLTNLK